MPNLSLKATAIGSLPHSSTQNATDLIWNTFTDIPFWPQLKNVNAQEDMIIQYSQNIPGMYINTEEQVFGFNPESDDFYEKLEEFFLDYDEIVEEKKYEKLDKYAITEPYASSIDSFLAKLKANKNKFAKGHITGPFTWGTSITDNEKKCLFYDETYRDIVVKALTIKALWQIKKIKEANEKSTPIIFMDEPSMSQVGTSAFVTVKEEEVVESVKTIAEAIIEAGGIPAVHCCGKADWGMVLDMGIKILNFDAYSFTKNLTAYSNRINDFIRNGGYISWGIVPTLDEEALKAATAESLYKKLEEGFDALSEKGLDRKLVIQQSFVTPSCGAGCLSEDLAEKAMKLTKEISDKLRTNYEDN